MTAVFIFLFRFARHDIQTKWLEKYYVRYARERAERVSMLRSASIACFVDNAISGSNFWKIGE
jgi:hypothetical protein